MKKILITLIFSILLNFSYAQGPNWVWAKKAYTVGNARIYGTCNDTLGNFYMTGSFTHNSIDFGGTTLVNASLGSEDIFVVKYDSLGNEIWAKRFGGNNNERASAIACDKNNHLYITGYYETSFIAGTDTLIAPAYKDVFTIQMNLAGNVKWTRVARGNDNNDYGSQVKTFSDGSALVVGDFVSNKLIVGSDTLINDTTYAYQDIFLIKYDTLGNVVWTNRAGGNREDYCQGLDIDVFDNIYLTGNFMSYYCYFDAITLLKPAGNLFLTKYNPNGTVIWAKNKGGAGIVTFANVAIDANNFPVIVGDFFGVTLTLGATTLTNTTSGSTDIFLTRSDTAGNTLWAKSFPGDFNYDNSYGIAADSWGNTFIAGEFLNMLYFENDTITGIGFTDLFLAEFDSNGNEKWVKVIGGMDADKSPACVSVDKTGNIYYTGGFTNGTITFPGVGSITNSYLILDPFIAKLDGPYFSSFSQVACDSITINGTTYFNSGAYPLVLTNTSGADSIVTAYLTINTINSAVVISGSLFSAASSVGTYQWLDCDNSFAIIPGATSQNYTAVPGNNYKVTISNLGCIDTSTCYHISLADIEEGTTNFKFKVFPNPFNSKIIIDAHTFSPEAEISLITTLGEKINSFKNESTLQEIDLTSIPSGIYFISITEKNKSCSVRKIIKL